MFARATEVEPLIGDVWADDHEPQLPPLVSANTVDQVAAMYACQQAAGFARARIVLVISDPRWGGGRRIEGHIAHALSRRRRPARHRRHLHRQWRRAPPGRLPAGVREVDLAGAVGGDGPRGQPSALVELIRSFCADAVVNINARLLYEALASYGKALVSSERLFLMQFCNEQQAQGNWVGLPLALLLPLLRPRGRRHHRQ